MIWRHAHQRSFVFLRRHELHRAEDIGEQIGVTQDGSLWRSGRAAGEQLHGNCFFRLGQVVRRRATRIGRTDEVSPRLYNMPGAQARRTRTIANDERRRDAFQQRPEILIRQPVIQRHIRHTGQRRAEQSNRRRFGAFVEQRHMTGAARLDLQRRATRRRQKRAIGPAPSATHQSDALRRRISGHAEHQRNIHLSILDRG